LALFVEFMASAKQIAANRRNALRSTGPKNRETVRFNALRHGLRARILILPDEDPAEFNNLLQDLETEWQPQTPSEFIQVERMAVNYWKLARADRREAFYRLNDMPDRFVDQSFRFQQGLERSFDRAQKTLEHLQTDRCVVIAEDSPAAAVEAPAVKVIETVEVRSVAESPEQTAEPAASIAPPPISEIARRYLSRQSAEIEKREKALMRDGFYRRGDSYPKKPTVRIVASPASGDQIQADPPHHENPQ
jgi:hypothetical protein